MAEKTDIYFDRVLPRWDWLPEELAEQISGKEDILTGIRLRADRPAQLVFTSGDRLVNVVGRREFMKMLSKMLGHSLYARQDELSKGYFTLNDGSRVGVAGKFSKQGIRSIEDIGGVNIRIAHEIKGCAASVMNSLNDSRGAVIISPPGMGKTTLLRDIAQQLSVSGVCVCVIDERDELAACRNGIPLFDLGPRTDVISGLAKSEAILQAVRACAPDVIIADEIGEAEDAAAIYDALRCGVRFIVSAHGDSLDKRFMRPVAAEIIDAAGVGILLGPAVGMVRQIMRFDRGEVDA